MTHKPLLIMPPLVLWTDAIIDPLETRKVISMGIEAANNAPIKEAYNPGIIQS